MYELSERDRGLIRASIRMTINVLLESRKNLELRREYKDLMKKLG